MCSEGFTNIQDNTHKRLYCAGMEPTTRRIVGLARNHLLGKVCCLRYGQKSVEIKYLLEVFVFFSHIDLTVNVHERNKPHNIKQTLYFYDKPI